jgi:hypothetical protein
VNFAVRFTAANQCPQHLNTCDVSEHPEHLDDEIDPDRRAAAGDMYLYLHSYAARTSAAKLTNQSNSA